MFLVKINQNKYFLVILLFVLMILHVNVVEARPPSQMDLTYDKETQILHVEMTHITRKPHTHYIRRLYVFKNGEEIAKISYVSQQKSSKLIQDISIDVEDNDIILVRAICSKAGRNDVTLKISE